MEAFNGPTLTGRYAQAAVAGYNPGMTDPVCLDGIMPEVDFAELERTKAELERMIS